MNRVFELFGQTANVCDLENNCKLLPFAGRLKKLKITPKVGDIVEVENDLITDIKPRKNELIRPKVANIDQVLVFLSVKEPDFSSFLLDKYLAIVESKNIDLIIFLTKSDLDLELANHWKQKYEMQNYKVFLLSSNDNNYDEIKKLFDKKFSIVMGQSGVGKTTFINNISNNNYKTQQISKSLSRGKHTTTSAKIISFLNGFLIDSPGFSSLDVEKEINLNKSYLNFKELAKLCEFKDCMHNFEKNCNVKLNLNSNLVPEFRYKNYLKLLKEQNERK